MAELEEREIQRLILSGNGRLPFGYFVLLSIRDPEKAKDWLGRQAGRITYGGETSGRPDQRMNVAITWTGLEKLGLPPDALIGFSDEFREGPLEGRRLRFMGDEGSSAPEHWHWGGPGQPAVHLLLLLYGATADARDDLFAEVCGSPRADGVREIQVLDADLSGDLAGHFGFRDGIVQPALEGRSQAGHPRNTVPAGEFLLGYRNGHGAYPPSPSVPAARDPRGILPASADGSGGRDFGRNGSYLVYRLLRQNVESFWTFIEEAVAGEADPEAAKELLAAKMVGRWRSGAPLVLSPDHDDPARLENGEDYFGYSELDPGGHRCPFGAHIRRANPRDSLSPNPNASTRVSNFHRLIRRGRPYEIPAVPGAGAAMGRQVEAARVKRKFAEQASPGEKGLHFVCFNADIANQFEFVQHDWINNPKFDGILYADADPLVGAQDLVHPEWTGTFTIQGRPLRKEIKGLQRFVDVRGAAYLFMPGRQAMKYLLAPPPATT